MNAQISTMERYKGGGAQSADNYRVKEGFDQVTVE